MRCGSLIALTLLLGCGPAELVSESPETEGDVSASTALRARARDTTVWIDPIATRRQSDGNPFLTLNGRASRNITGGLGFVLDDPYGDFRTPSARTFQLWYSPTELTSLVVGVQQFVGIDFAPSGSRPARLTARVLVAPTLSSFAGSGLFLDATTQVVNVGGRPVMQISGRSDRDLRRLRVSAGDVSIPDFRLESPRRFVIHLGMDHVIALATGTARLSIVGVAARSTVTKSARIDLAVTSLDLTDGDAYEVWPTPTCADDVVACLSALPVGSVDLSSCGSYLAVAQCYGRTGAAVDDVAFTSALARAAARLKDVGLERDASALVGPGRAASFTDNVYRTVESRFESFFGQVFPTVAERDGALDGAAEIVFDTAFARPLDFVEAVVPVGNDVQNARDVAADALLTYLATHDLRQTEWGRPLEVLTREYRDRHVAALRELREVGSIVGTTETQDVLTVNWLGALVEVTIERSTGRIVLVHFEID